MTEIERNIKLIQNPCISHRVDRAHDFTGPGWIKLTTSRRWDFQPSPDEIAPPHRSKLTTLI
jgi:hypothetical protein